MTEMKALNRHTTLVFALNGSETPARSSNDVRAMVWGN